MNLKPDGGIIFSELNKVFCSSSIVFCNFVLIIFVSKIIAILTFL